MKTGLKLSLAGIAAVMLASVSVKIWADNAGATNTPDGKITDPPAATVAQPTPKTANTAVVAPPAAPASAFDADPLKEWVSIETARLTKAIPFLEGLDIKPQIISAADGKGSTFGLGYNYDRELVGFSNSLAGDLSVKFHSDGIYLADPKSIPNNVFTHSLKLTWIDILPPKFDSTDSQAVHLQKVQANRLAHEYDQWQDETDAAKKDAMFYEAAKEIRGNNKLVVKANQWFVTGTNGQVDVDTYLQQLRKITPRAVFLSADIGGDIEHDQRLNNVQYVGDVGVRSKLIHPIFDFPASLIRRALGSNKDGNGAILDYRNLGGGPYVWGGMGVVDASQNAARKAITMEQTTFPRANLGAFYRTELYGISESQSVALELNYSLYYEFGAPAAIRARNLELTSYFKATLLLPVIKSGDAFVEYSVGQLPVDLTDGQTISAGWRYSF